MLSFLREQDSEGAIDGAAQDTEQHSSPDNSQQPDTQPQQQQQYLTVNTKSRSARKTTILLTVCFSAGLVALFFMIKTSTPQKAAANTKKARNEQAQIEKAIAELTGIRSKTFNSVEQIVDKFHEFSQVKQVKLRELVKNPFMSDVFAVDLKNAEETDSDIRANRLAQQAQSMQLLAIMQRGANKCCMIGDQILREGDSIGGFTVRQINDDSVMLQSWYQSDSSFGTQILLSLSE